MTDLKPILSSFKKEIKEILGKNFQDLILFGSYARATADNNSDIDILVDLDYSQKIGLGFIQMKIDLQNILNANVDLVSSNGLSKYIKPVIDQEKKLIYAR